jgi:hypothetical protein
MKLIQERTINTNFDKLQPIEVSLDVVLMIPAKNITEACAIIDTLSLEEMLTIALAHLDFLSEDYDHIKLN